MNLQVLGTPEWIDFSRQLLQNRWAMDLLRDLWRYRELSVKLASKDIKVRYKHPILGFLWALLVPTSMILILTFIFSVLLKVPNEGVPFVVYISTAMFPWTFFQLALGSSVTSVVDSGSLIKKVYFPRELIPLSIVLANLVNFVLSLALLVLALRFFDIAWSWRLILLPAIIVLHLTLTAGLALLVSALQVEFRDMKYIVEIGLVLWFYLVPVFYPLTIFQLYPPPVVLLYLMNPMVGIVTFYRWALLPGYTTLLPIFISWTGLMGYTVIVSIAILMLGASVFRRRQSVFADWV